MIRLATWIVASLVISALVAWLLSLTGTVTLELGGYRLQPRLGTAVFILLGIIAAVVILWSLFRRLLAAPRVLARRAAERRKEQGIVALSEGFVALQAGDPARARQFAREAQQKLPGNAASYLMEARADLALGDMAAAREHYRGLISNGSTAVAALAGLYDQARAQGRSDAALTFAKKAVELAPGAGWANAAVFDDLTRRARWGEALAMVGAEPATTRDEKARKRRKQAVIESALARVNEPTDPALALEHALTALKLIPDFVPAALIAARIHSGRGEGRKAMSLLRRVWRTTGHPDVATLYAHSIPGVSPADRLKRLRDLIESPPPSADAAVVLARAAVEAQEWSAARNALAKFLANAPSQAICTLMAEIEEGQSGDQGKAREWLSRAVRAPRDPVWTADGITSDEWEPVSPVSGKLDAFEWRVPVSAVATRPEAAAVAPPERPLALPEA